MAGKEPDGRYRHLPDRGPRPPLSLSIQYDVSQLITELIFTMYNVPPPSPRDNTVESADINPELATDASNFSASVEVRHMLRDQSKSRSNCAPPV